MKINEDNFIEELKNKNNKALEYFINNYSDLILKVSYSVLKDIECSKECANDVLLKIWNSAGNFNKEKSKFTTWVIVLAKNTAIDYLRKDSKHFGQVTIEDNLTADNFDVHEEFENKNNFQLIIDGIKKMENDNKEIFIRRFFFNESLKDISSKMGLTVSGVANRLMRSKKKLQEVIEREVI